VSASSTIALVTAALILAACGNVTQTPAPAPEAPPTTAPAAEPVCEVSNTAPGCVPSSIAWVVTCDASVPKPAVWCSMPERDTSGKVWCC
jgi:hypothetical protein